ncbi:SWIM zinc finger family protein [Buchananella hordeovulneris]|uniref:SWIM-type domain-containing protein n=1 Tax=Buchananella hordeovulneris TaxID=52770 RepID=A0A1Q5PX37_9ACTO|nr:SWIM zinc finger family protein [Buchananella hordeovulneris]MDO5080324.1 SWIM zinc finger family protein [Buchananella hordeovulneris]OKL52184.1 hypothetical protein BSZ40_04600 [Buchananella hordeovulneris]RRD51734.1 SWIM zinc finger family protein [Buchananella hordeovulneris]
MTTLTYHYLSASALASGSGRAELALTTSGGCDPSGAVAHPYFFSGFVSHPGVVAAALLAVARVARTRYYIPPNMLAAVLRAADPVVTSTAEGLRFESFSACCGVYARLDVDSGALDASFQAVGVTNVDVNPPLRQALAGLRAGEPLHLEVGSAALHVRTLDAAVTEEQVPLPTRWLKGFAETQMLSANMTLRHSLAAPAARQFLQALPRSSTTKSVLWATRAARGLRLASRPSPGAVCVAGPERLRSLEPLLRFAQGLDAYSAPVDGNSLPQASVWVLRLPGARLSLGLSPEKARGFSGEGAVLHALAGEQVAADADLLEILLRFEPRIDVARMAREAAVSPQRVHAGLALLASSGQVGFDVAAGAYFHRPLPVQAEALSALHPRLTAAHGLVAAGAVSHAAEVTYVQSGTIRYEVRLGGQPQDDRCTCPWYAKHRGTRGPCKHVLAARIAPQEASHAAN